MELWVLGPVKIIRDGAAVDIEAPKHRALLATLALHGGGLVSPSELIDALWGDDPPETAAKTLQSHVSVLRKQFGDDLITTDAVGYALGPAIEEVDAIELAAAVSAGRAHLDAGNAAAARRSFASATALWRGHPLDDLAPGPISDGQTARLEEIRLLAVEGTVESELAVGHHREVVPDLERLVVEHRYREVLWRSLMLALYRSGRPADALGAYRRLRTALIDELGIEPSVETQSLEVRILDRDLTLDPPAVVPPTNLAVPLDSFVDRVVEHGQIVELIGEHRLVTVLGLGGVGKSRLANEAGRIICAGIPGGVWWVDLAAVPAADAVLVHVAAAMDLPAAPGPALETVLLARLRDRATVLVLDNCEHVRDAVASFVEWVTASDPLVRILTTSRVPLDIAGEQRVHIEPLAVHPAVGQSVSAASRLFLDRASARVDLGSVAIAEVEALTDVVGGLPLGIELAAAQCALRTPGEIARALLDRDALLALADGEHRPARHTSLGHVLDTSINALEPDLAAVAARLAVLPGDFDLAAATAVLGTPRADAEHKLSRLLDASLVTRTPSDAPQRRFRVLWPIREYLDDRLDDRDRHDAEQRHAQHFQAFARRFIDAADTPAEPGWVEQALVDDHNLRVALAWFEIRDPEGALAFGPGLGWAKQLRGDFIEWRETLRRLLAKAPDAPSDLIAWTEEAFSWMELLSGDPQPAFDHNLDAVARFEQLDERRGLSRALYGQAHALFLGGFDTGVTSPIYERAIEVARQAGAAYSEANGQVRYAHALASADGEFGGVDVEAMLSQAESVFRQYGDHASLAHASLARAAFTFGRGDTSGLRAAGEEVLRQSRLANAPLWEQGGMFVLGVAAYEEGDGDEHRRRFHDAVHLAHDAANRFQLGLALHALSATSAERAPETAARLWGAACTFAPLSPTFSRRYGEWIEAAREVLGDRFDELEAEGAVLSVDDAVALADTIL